MLRQRLMAASALPSSFLESNLSSKAEYEASLALQPATRSAALPSSFLASNLSTKAEYEASLALPPATRSAAERAAFEMKEPPAAAAPPANEQSAIVQICQFGLVVALFCTLYQYSSTPPPKITMISPKAFEGKTLKTRFEGNSLVIFT